MRLRRRTRARLAVHHSKMRHARSTWRASDAWARPAWPIPRDADHHGAAQLMELLDAAVTLVAPDSPLGSNFDIVCNPALNLVEMAALHLLVTLIGRSNAR